MPNYDIVSTATVILPSLRAMSEQPVKPADTENALGGRWIPLESNPDVRSFNVLAAAINLCLVESSFFFSTCLTPFANRIGILQLMKLS